MANLNTFSNLTDAQLMLCFRIAGSIKQLQANKIKNNVEFPGTFYEEIFEPACAAIPGFETMGITSSQVMMAHRQLGMGGKLEIEQILTAAFTKKEAAAS